MACTISMNHNQHHNPLQNSSFVHVHERLDRLQIDEEGASVSCPSMMSSSAEAANSSLIDTQKIRKEVSKLL